MFNKVFSSLRWLSMKRHYEIVPGKSVGPFKLGMTRQEIAALRDAERAKGVRFPLADVGDQPVKGGPSPGVYFHYDASGKCCKIDALFGYKISPPVFTLLGHITNGMTGDEAASILGGRASYAAIESAGARAIKWEASDEHIMCIVVTPA